MLARAKRERANQLRGEWSPQAPKRNLKRAAARGSVAPPGSAKPQPIILRGKAHLLDQSLHWRLYYDVFRVLYEGDGKQKFSALFLQDQMDKIFKQYSLQHFRPADSDASDSAAADNSTFFTYDEEHSRMAYYTHRVPKHAVTIGKCLLISHKHIRRLLTEAAEEGRPFVVASFGGGPSSDLFGFLLYLDETDWGAGGAPNVTFVFHVFDLEAWAPFWSHIAAALPKYYPSIQVHFHTADLASPDSAHLVAPETQLLLFSYFIVEMTPFAEGFTAFFTALVATVRPDALFVAIDSKMETVSVLRGRLTAATELTVALMQCKGLCMSFPYIVPKSRHVHELHWIRASMTPHLELWKARQDSSSSDVDLDEQCSSHSSSMETQ
jgi:hypothetical protein